MTARSGAYLDLASVRSAPPAAGDVALDGPMSVALTLLVLLAAGALLQALLSRLTELLLPPWAAFGAWALAWPLSQHWRTRSRALARRLVWDGQGWYLLGAAGSAESGRPTLVFDAGSRLLVRWRGAGPSLQTDRRSLWLPIARSASSAEWHALRTALIWAAP